MNNLAGFEEALGDHFEDVVVDQLVHLEDLNGSDHQSPQFGQILEGEAQLRILKHSHQTLGDGQGEHLVLDLDGLGLDLRVLLITQGLVDSERYQIRDIFLRLLELLCRVK